MSTLSSTLPSSLKFLLLLSHILYSITTTTSSPYTFIYGGCSRIKYNSNQQYENNVNSLLTTLVNSASSAPFTKFTTGGPASPLYGAYQCRGDLSQRECVQCVQHALSALGNLCPDTCGAEVQLEGCFVKYDNATFLGVADKTVVMKKCGGGGGGDEVERVLGYVASRDGLYYRVGEVGRVRGVAQCVGDLSPSQCQSCVGYAVQRFRSDCGSVGSGDMFLAKCYVRISSNGGSNGDLGYLTPEDLEAIGLDAENNPLDPPSKVDLKRRKPTLRELIMQGGIPDRPMGRKRAAYKSQRERVAEQGAQPALSVSSPRPDPIGAGTEHAPTGVVPEAATEAPLPSPPREVPDAVVIESESPHSEDARPTKKQKKGSSSKARAGAQGQVSVAVPGVGASGAGGSVGHSAGLVEETPPIAGGLVIRAIDLGMQLRRSADSLAKFAQDTAGELDRLRREAASKEASQELKEVAALKAEVESLQGPLKDKESQLEGLIKEKESLALQYTELFQHRDAAVARAEAAEAERSAGQAKAARLELEMEQMKAAHQVELAEVRANSFYDGVDFGSNETKGYIDKVDPNFNFARLAELEEAADRERQAGKQATGENAGC